MWRQQTIYICVCKDQGGTTGTVCEGEEHGGEGARTAQETDWGVCVYEEGYEIRNLMAEGEVDFIFVVACGVVTVAGPNVFDTTSTV